MMTGGNQNASLRKGVNLFVFTLTGISITLTIGILCFLLLYILYMGLPALTFSFFTESPRSVGEGGGGIAHAIVGTLKLLGIAILIACPVGFLGGIYLSEFGHRSRIAYSVRYAADVLTGIPSIVIGIFAYTVFVLPLKHFSTLAGGISLSIILLPIVLKGTEEFLRLVPSSLREAGLALGMAQWRMILTIIVPSAFSGILTCMMLGVARVAGETAPLLFTAFGNQYWSSGWLEPTASIPVIIYTYSISPYQEWQQQAWAAGTVLLLLVFFANIFSRIVLRRQEKAAR